MKSIKEYLQTGDFKGEKHVPIIHIDDEIKADEMVELKVSIGDEIAHPNTVEHHISWIKVFFIPDEGKFPIELGTFNFTAHGEGNIFNKPSVSTNFKTTKPGSIHVISYCNLHGLWENSKEIKIK
ncbi:MAG: superoxide reductase [Firmicutes bacterium]|nr:superoxide reductase [Bacillota bacterium]